MRHPGIRSADFRKLSGPAAAVAAALCASGSAVADTYMWNTGSGGFHVSGNWMPSGPPGVDDDARFHRLTSPNTISFTSAADNPTNANLLVTFGTFNFVSSGGPWTYTLTNTASIQSSSVLNLGTQANNRINLAAGTLSVRSGGVLNIRFGSQAIAERLEIADDFSTNGGTVTVDGVGSSLVVGSGGVWLGQHVAPARLTFSNGATGRFDSALRLVVGGTHSAKAYLSVLSGSQLHASSLLAGTDSIWSHEAIIDVQGAGSSIVQSESSSLTLDGTAQSTLWIGTISGGSGASFTTGSGLTTIGPAGRVEVGSPISSGAFNVNGDILIVGGQINIWPGQSQAFNWAPGRTMTIQHGGVVNLPLDDQNSLPPRNAVIRVMGSGSQLNGAGAGLVLQNDAQLIVATGATATYRDFVIGREQSGGSLIVEMPGAKLTADGMSDSESSIGADGGSGVLAIRLGARGEFGSHPLYVGRRHDGGHGGGSGTINLAFGGTIESAGDVLIGHDSTTTGAINIQGDSAAMTQSGATSLTVGAASGPAGAAQLNIGTLASGATYTTGTGPAIVNSTGVINLASASTTGTFDGNGDISIVGGEVNIFQGGTLTTKGSTAVHAGGRINILGGVVSLQSLEVQGGIIEFGHGSLSYAGDLHVASGGLLGADLALPPSRNLALTGTATVEEGNTLTLGGGAFSAGAIVLSAGSRLVSAAATGASAAVVAHAGSTIDARGGDLTIGDTGRDDGFYSNGTILTGSRTLTVADANEAVLGEAALVTLGAGSSPGALATAKGLTLQAGAHIFGYGTLDTPDHPATPLANNGSLIGNSPDRPLTLAGHVKGVGIFHNVAFTGTYSPESGPAQIKLGNASYQGMLRVEVAGPSSGSDHHQLNHILGDGIVSLGGTLAIALVDDYLPLPGQAFQIMTYSAREGEFAAIVSHAATAGLWFDAEYDDRFLNLRAVARGGDANLDGNVDVADLGILAANWQQSDRTWLYGDFNDDGVVNIGDLGILASNWQAGMSGGPFLGFADAMAIFDAFDKLGAGVFGGTIVPEPGVMGMIGLGLVMLGRRRRTRD